MLALFLDFFLKDLSMVILVKILIKTIANSLAYSVGYLLGENPNGLNEHSIYATSILFSLL